MRQGYDFRSRPAWGAWIEITTVLPSTSMRMSRPARGAWIESRDGTLYRLMTSRAPHGARGLK